MSILFKKTDFETFKFPCTFVSEFVVNMPFIVASAFAYNFPPNDNVSKTRILLNSIGTSGLPPTFNPGKTILLTYNVSFEYIGPFIFTILSITNLLYGLVKKVFPVTYTSPLTVRL